MNDFDDRTNLWDYRDNSAPNRSSGDSSYQSRRGQDTARAYAAYDEDDHGRRDHRRYHQSQNQSQGQFYPEQQTRAGSFRGQQSRNWRDNSYPENTSRQGRYGAARRGSEWNRDEDRQSEEYYRMINQGSGASQDRSSGKWPSELGYPPARETHSPYGFGNYSQNNRQSNRDDYDREDRGFFERAGDEFLSWFGDRDATRRRELDHRGRGPKAYVRSDERIREDVNERLTEDVWVDASEIEVSVAEGEVTLSGTVDSRRTKRRAEDCADSVTGVKHVQNNLRYTSGVISPALDGS